MKYIKVFGQFWYDFIIADDWKVAVAVVCGLAVGAVLMFTEALPDRLLTPAIAALLIAAFSASMAIDVRPAKRR